MTSQILGKPSDNPKQQVTHQLRASFAQAHGWKIRSNGDRVSCVSRDCPHEPGFACAITLGEFGVGPFQALSCSECADECTELQSIMVGA